MLKIKGIVPRNRRGGKANVFFEDGSCCVWLRLDEDWELQIVGGLPQDHWLVWEDYLEMTLGIISSWEGLTGFALENGLIPSRPFLVRFEKPKAGITQDTWMGPGEYWFECDWEIVWRPPVQELAAEALEYFPGSATPERALALVLDYFLFPDEAPRTEQEADQILEAVGMSREEVDAFAGRVAQMAERTLEQLS